MPNIDQMYQTSLGEKNKNSFTREFAHFTSYPAYPARSFHCG